MIRLIGLRWLEPHVDGGTLPCTCTGAFFSSGFMHKPGPSPSPYIYFPSPPCLSPFLKYPTTHSTFPIPFAFFLLFIFYTFLHLLSSCRARPVPAVLIAFNPCSRVYHIVSNLYSSTRNQIKSLSLVW